MKKKIKFFIPSINEKEINNVKNVLKSGWLTNGKKTIEFEKKIKKFIGSNYAIAVNSCTNGIFAVLHALNFKKGDEIITTPMTFVSTIHNLYSYGLNIKLVDINLDDLSFDENILKKSITKKTKGILINHYGGMPTNTKNIIQISKKYKIKLIEDAATVFGAKINNQMIGSNPDIVSVFSFYSNKVITTGEGGVITTCNRKIAEKLKVLISCGISKTPWQRSKGKSGLNWRYEVNSLGFKFNFTDLQASIGIEQLKKIQSILKYRKILRKYYFQYLKNLEKKGCIKVFRNKKNISFSEYIFPIILKRNKNFRDNLISFLNKNNINTSVHYIPANKHKFYKKVIRKYDLKRSDYAFDNLISLPFHNYLSKSDIKYISKKIEQFFEKNY